VSAEVVAALIGLAGVQLATSFALWLKIEHRVTVLEERVKAQNPCAHCRNFNRREG